MASAESATKAATAETTAATASAYYYGRRDDHGYVEGFVCHVTAVHASVFVQAFAFACRCGLAQYAAAFELGGMCMAKGAFTIAG